MGSQGDDLAVSVLAFGPLAERLGGRVHTCRVPGGSDVRQLVVGLELEEWISFGLSVAVNGQRCGMDTTLSQGDEVALLPPVSGG